jgi:hypothetical protein
MVKSINILCAIVIIAMTGVVTENISAQSLTFSQVLLVGNATQTVPTGKVWKIENYLLNNSATLASNAQTFCGGTATNASFYVTPPGGSATAFFLKPGNFVVNASNQGGYGVVFPIWLPEGTALQSNCASWYLSVIEFSVVP